MNSKRDQCKPAGKTRKAYRKPALEVYGSIRSLTRAAGMTSAVSDGATMGGNRKTM